MLLSGHAQSDGKPRRVFEHVGRESPSNLGEWSIYIIVHVGGTRCGTSSADRYMKRRARITLNVECIRPCNFIFLLYVSIQ